MAVAGFYAIHNSEIRFGADGRWYADGEPITNDRIARLFSRSVEPDGEGGYRLRVGDEMAPIAVDDTPYVVTSVSCEDPLEITLNDQTTEELDESSLEISADNVFYCRVKGGRERARLLRPAHYQLASLVAEDDDAGYVLRCHGRAIPIRSI